MCAHYAVVNVNRYGQRKRSTLHPRSTWAYRAYEGNNSTQRAQAQLRVRYRVENVRAHRRTALRYRQLGFQAANCGVKNIIRGEHLMIDTQLRHKNTEYRACVGWECRGSPSISTKWTAARIRQQVTTVVTAEAKILAVGYYSFRTGSSSSYDTNTPAENKKCQTHDSVGERYFLSAHPACACVWDVVTNDRLQYDSYRLFLAPSGIAFDLLAVRARTCTLELSTRQS